MIACLNLYKYIYFAKTLNKKFKTHIYNENVIALSVLWRANDIHLLFFLKYIMVLTNFIFGLLLSHTFLAFMVAYLKTKEGNAQHNVHSSSFVGLYTMIYRTMKDTCISCH